jgi:hypothetical protein
VQGLYDALLTTMKNGRTLGQSGRYTQLAPVIRRTFDIASMARLSTGPSWTGLSDAQRQQATESIGRYISAIYAPERTHRIPGKRCFRTRCVSADLPRGPHTRGKTRALPPCFYRRHRAHFPASLT